MKTIFTYLRPFLKSISIGFLIKSLGTIMELCLPYILAMMIDEIVPLQDKRLILFWGVIMITCSVIGVWGNITANRMASKVAKNSAEKMRHDLFERISDLSSKQVDEVTIPSLESRLTSDTYNVHRMIGMIQRMGVRAPILLLGGISITFIMEPILTLVLVATLPFIAAVVYRKATKGIPLYAEVQAATDDMIRVVRENGSGIRVIKALSKTDYEKNRYNQINQNLVDKEKRAGVAMAVTNPLMNLFLNLGLTAVILVGAYRVNMGLSETGKIIAFMTYFTLISNAMMSISRIFVETSKGIASADRIGKILTMPVDLATVKMDEKIGKEEGLIVFDQVSFSYNGVKNNLENINFKIGKGQTLGILGATGCGKTTILQLLMRFYDVNEGSIRINGRDIRTMKNAELRQLFGIVMQNDFLYADTIKENIRFGRDLTDEQIEEAIKVAQAEEFISELEKGVDHPLTSRGTNVSGGQKQRILLSRAFAANPEILILDDSSSALDYKTDAHLRKAIKEHFKETTTLIVAQRISSIMHADRILVLEEGKVIGDGTHEELLANCELYKMIESTQMGGAFVD